MSKSLSDGQKLAVEAVSSEPVSDEFLDGCLGHPQPFPAEVEAKEFKSSLDPADEGLVRVVNFCLWLRLLKNSARSGSKRRNRAASAQGQEADIPVPALDPIVGGTEIPGFRYIWSGWAYVTCIETATR